MLQSRLRFPEKQHALNTASSKQCRISTKVSDGLPFVTLLMWTESKFLFAVCEIISNHPDPALTNLLSFSTSYMLSLTPFVDNNHEA